MMKIKHYLVKGELKEVAPHIYCVAVEDAYDRAMLFSRYQEFYESPIKGIRNRFFTLEGLMKRYRDHYKKETFTYPEDWAGYNIPSYSLEKAIEKFGDKYMTEYDEIMQHIVSECETKSYSLNNCTKHNWYLIGTDNFKSRTMNHEMAHALYYTNSEYKRNCDALISKIKKSDYNKLNKALVGIGYLDNKKIIDDEIQAFMSTGLYSKLDDEKLKPYTKEFIKNFKLFNNG
jgi:hypothetical protein